VLGVGDDAAVIETGPLTLVTADSLIEGVHFRREWSPPRLLGRKALTVNLSDIAAMAGVPRYATVSLCLPPDVPMKFVDGLYDGLLERGAEAGVSIVGGNVSASWAELVIDITLIGSGDRILRRSGAVPGDLAVVTGTLGAAAAGLRLLVQGARLTEDGFLESTGVWTDSSADAVTRCLRAQLDPSPSAGVDARALRAGAGARSDGPVRRLVGRPAAHLSGERPGVHPGPQGRPGRPRGGVARARAWRRCGGPGAARRRGLPVPVRDPARPHGRPQGPGRGVGPSAHDRGEFTEGPPTVSIQDGETLKHLESHAHDHFKSRDFLAPDADGAPPLSRVGHAVKQLLQIEDTPHRIALSFGIGVWISFFPIWGIHTAMALGLAFALRLSRAAMVVGAWVNNPWTALPFYSAGTLLGCWLLRVPFEVELTLDWDVLRPYLWPFVVAATRSSAWSAVCSRTSSCAGSSSGGGGAQPSGGSAS
jgi:uncharacterized protein (DUF2062 family)